MNEQEAKVEEGISDKKRPLEEVSSDDDKKSNKRRKLESCLTELSDMLSQIRNDAKLVASSTMSRVFKSLTTFKNISMILCLRHPGLENGSAVPQTISS